MASVSLANNRKGVVVSITDELREYAGNYHYDGQTVSCRQRELTDIADRIDAAADLEKAGWVRGPLDADGEMWHSGDMSESNWGVIERIGYEDGTWYIKGHDTSAPWIRADSIRHYHEPTVEDVLREFVRDFDAWRDYDGPINETPSNPIAEYAAKLRLADDGEER